MARVTSKGLYVFDLSTDQYNHTQVAANWDLIDSLLGTPATSIQTLAAVPTTGNFAGRLVMLSVANSGFGAWSIIRYDGSTWRPVGYEILPAVPSAGNFAGRLVMLSGASSGFNAWDMIRYDGTIWDRIGGWASVNTGAGATNIKGLTTALDVQISDSARGFILKDRVTGTNYRLYMTGGGLAIEVVT
jgi:hypothetical protein